ncbi:MAG: hypothetical protein SF066_21240 [Thermoanaerobaculia bacterium]|nr:hypothetical protein [Thermoanaerobaculia bacterium]
MRFRISLLLLSLPLLSPPLGAACGCPAAAGDETPVFAVGLGATELVACGRRVAQDADRWLVAELEVRQCGTAGAVFQCAALQTCRVEQRVGALVVTELEELPFGKDWEWVDVPSVEHVFSLGADGQVTQKSRSVFTPPRIPAADVTRIHAGISAWDGLEVEAQEDLLYQTLALALGGDVKARQNLVMLRGLTWVGNLEDAYDEVVEIYEGYAERTGRLPRLAPPAVP